VRLAGGHECGWHTGGARHTPGACTCSKHTRHCCLDSQAHSVALMAHSQWCLAYWCFGNKQNLPAAARCGRTASQHLRLAHTAHAITYTVVTRPFWHATPSHAHCGTPMPCCVLQLRLPHGSGLLLLAQPARGTLLAMTSALSGCRAATARIHAYTPTVSTCSKCRQRQDCSMIIQLQQQQYCQASTLLPSLACSAGA
jgi:hypothetical protein